YGDWYLQSKHELNLLYLQRNVVGGISGYYYWSSTEHNSVRALDHYFGNGIQGSGYKYNASYVRAVRAF
ncbi:MAG: hypothetical protein AAB110_01325, partial [Candidatus Desantisbacteria bacterium]